MRQQIKLIASLLLCLATAEAQVSSHVPTTLTQPSAAPAVLRPQRAGDRAVARVNGSVLTAADLLREEYAIFPYARQHNGIPKEFEKQIRDGALKMMVFEELVYQEAQRRKMTVPQSKMQRAEVEFRKQFATPDQFKAFLQNDFHGSQQLLDEKIRRSLLIEALLKTVVDDKCVLSPADVRAYYDRNTSRFHHPETFTFQTISVLPPTNATASQLAEGRKRIDGALKQARATKTSEEFGLLAEKVSDDDYRVVMGQHKPVAIDQLAPPVVKALLGMQPGQVSDVIQLDQAYTIVRLQEHALAGQTKFELVKAQLAKELQEKKRNQLRAAFDQKLRQNAKVEEM